MEEHDNFFLDIFAHGNYSIAQGFQMELDDKPAEQSVKNTWTTVTPISVISEFSLILLPAVHG